MPAAAPPASGPQARAGSGAQWRRKSGGMWLEAVEGEEPYILKAGQTGRPENYNIDKDKNAGHYDDKQGSSEFGSSERLCSVDNIDLLLNDVVGGVSSYLASAKRFSVLRLEICFVQSVETHVPYYYYF